MYGHQSHDPGSVLVKDENFKSVGYNTNKKLNIKGLREGEGMEVNCQ